LHALNGNLKQEDFLFFISNYWRRVVHLKAFGINACGKGSQNNCKDGNKEALLTR